MSIFIELCALVEKGCDFFLMSLCGPTLQLNASRIQVYVSETPAGMLYIIIFITIT